MTRECTAQDLMVADFSACKIDFAASLVSDGLRRLTVELSRPGGRRGRLERLLDALKRQLATASTHPYQVCTCHMCSSGSLLPELLGEPDENSFGAPDVAEPIRVFVLDHFADELRAAFAEPGERIVDVLHGEHDA